MRSVTMSAPIQPGATLESVLMGPVLDGHLALWDGANRPTLWRTDDASSLAARLGRGGVARSEVEPGRFRESGLLDRTSSTLFVPDRYTREGGTHATSFPLHAGDQPTADADALWAELRTWLADVLEAAAERGDYVVLEHGGYEFPQEPFALAICVPAEGGGAISSVEAAPAPRRPPWPAPAADARAATLSAPATRDVIRGAAVFLVAAVADWSVSPWTIGVTFGRVPS